MKKRTCKIIDFAVSAVHRVKLKESGKKDKYLYLTKEQKKKNCGTWKLRLSYLPTPPLGQDMTQGQFLRGV